ncbi:MAG: hypothetical protein WA733_25565 [Methylocystis sp.]
MPGFYPSQPESADNASDKALRARARQLADDIEARHASLDPGAVSSPVARALVARLVERLPYAATALRGAADGYPGPHPRPFQYYATELYEADRALLDERIEVNGLGGIGYRLDQLNTDWPSFDGMLLRQLRAEVEAGAAGAAAVLKSAEAAGALQNSFV